MTGLWIVPIIWVTGEFFLSLCSRRGARFRVRDFPFTFGAGWGLCFMFWLLLNEVVPRSPWWYTVLPLGLGLTVYWLRSRRAEPDAAASSWCRFDYGVLAALFVVITLVVATTLSLPILDWDTRILWALKAKLLAGDPKLAADAFFNPYRLHIHPRYPLMVPWLGAVVAGNGVAFSEKAYQIFLLSVGMLSLWQFYLLVSVVAGRRTALTAGLILTVSGVWMQALLESSVEVALVYFLLVALEAVRRSLKSRRVGDYITAGLIMAALAMVKNEGVLLAVALVAGYIVAGFRETSLRVSLRRGCCLGALWGSGYLIWLIRMMFIPPVSDENYWQRLNYESLAAGVQRSGILLSALMRQMTTWPLWHVTWLLPIVLILNRWGRPGKTAGRSTVSIVVAVTAFLYTTGVIFVYLLSPWRDLAMHVEVTFSRIMLPMLPLLLLLFMEHFAIDSALVADASCVSPVAARPGMDRSI